MRSPRLVVLALIAVPCLVAGAGADPFPAPPPGARGLLLLTGADGGYVEPKGCWGYEGGSLYRPALDRWLASSWPSLPRLWVSTGNVTTLPEFDDGVVADPARSFAHLDATGYAVVGVGAMDLDRLGPDGLRALRGRHAFELVATNLVEFETGRPLVAPVAVREVAGRRIAFLAVLEHQPERVWVTGEGLTVVTVDPERAVREQLARIGDDVDAVVLLSTLLQGSLRALLRAVPPFDLVAASSGTYFTRGTIDLEGHPVVWLGNWGQRLGVVPLDRDGALGPAVTVRVDETFPVDPATGRLRERAARAETR
ncbi:MAG: hypothetical protein D6738_10985 [Acidobacteria bacterium]|nr:MAG: hypothetical protein D6738_10985 [Acidobacteriota bacterium]